MHTLKAKWRKRIKPNDQSKLTCEPWERCCDRVHRRELGGRVEWWASLLQSARAPTTCWNANHARMQKESYLRGNFLENAMLQVRWNFNRCRSSTHRQNWACVRCGSLRGTPRSHCTWRHRHVDCRIQRSKPWHNSSPVQWATTRNQSLQWMNEKRPTISDAGWKNEKSQGRYFSTHAFDWLISLTRQLTWSDEFNMTRSRCTVVATSHRAWNSAMEQSGKETLAITLSLCSCFSNAVADWRSSSSFAPVASWRSATIKVLKK